MTFGLRQSPIDLASAVEGDSGELFVEYGISALDSRDTASTREHNVAEGNSISYRGRRYALEQFHFHTPSEHALDGEFGTGEIHFVHTDSSGETVVVGVFVEAGGPVIPLDDSEGTIDLRHLLPARLTHYAYEGSLTTLPFTEGVDWIILAETLSVELEQVERLRGRFGVNNRAIQPLNGRAVVLG